LKKQQFFAHAVSVCEPNSRLVQSLLRSCRMGIENDTATILRSLATHGARLVAAFGHDGDGQIGSRRRSTLTTWWDSDDRWRSSRTAKTEAGADYSSFAQPALARAMTPPAARPLSQLWWDKWP